MKKMFSAVLLGMLTFSSAFADCRNAYEVKARARAELVRDFKKAGAITGTVVISATTLATMAVIFVVAPGPGWFAIPPVFFGGSQAEIYLMEKNREVRANNLNTYYKALGTITAAEKGSLPTQLLNDLNEKLNLKSLSNEDQERVLIDVVEIIKSGNENELFCQRSDNGKLKIYNYRKLIKYIVSEIQKT